MRVMMHHDADPACPLVCFAQVVARDPFLLVGRTRKSAFRWRDLVGLRVAPAGDVAPYERLVDAELSRMA
jgi:NitT/TauT family transport system substrate-binding protein